MKFYYDIEIDLHGYTAEDAITEIERIIYSGQYSSVMIVHGRGKGILKDAIRNFLRENDFISGYATGEELNLPGSDGITIIYI